MKYRPEIDGLRAIAVTPVILFHAGIEQLSGGFLGVDVFFVISGYLITTIILSEKDCGRFSLLSFYERRARRILPALFFVMLISLPFAWLWLLPSDHKDFSQSLISVAFFSSNILFWLESGYFDAAAEMKPLLHTWSLAVEEQYYVFFPIFLIFFWRLRKRWIFSAILTLGLISLLIAQWGAYYAPDFNFYMLPTRAWELMAGALAAFYLLYAKSNHQLINNNHVLGEVLGGLGLALIIFSVIYYNDKMPLPSFYTFVPILGSVLIILYTSEKTLIGKILGSRVFVGVGLISYSLYLWHQPIFVFAKHRSLEDQSIIETLLLISSTFFLAYLTWMYIEKPFRNKNNINRIGVFIFALVGSFFFVIIGSIGTYKNGFDTRVFWFSNLLSYEFDNRKLQSESWNILRNISGYKNYGVENNDFDDEPWFSLELNKKRLLLVGNSHSKDIFNVLYHSKSVTSDYQIARYGVQIHDLENLNHRFYSSRNYNESQIIILATKFSDRDISSLPKVIEKMQFDGKSVRIVKRIFDFQYNKIRFKNLADVELSKWCSNTCREDKSIEISDRINESYFNDYIKPENRLRESQRINVGLENVAAAYDVKIFNRMDYVCDVDGRKCFSINKDFEKYFYDYGHHTISGAQYFGSRVDEINWLKDL